MTTSKEHLVGHLIGPDGKPQNVQLTLNRRYPDKIPTAFTDADTTPSVKTTEDNLVFKTANTSATTITDFDDGFRGQKIDVIIDDANTTIDFTGTNLTRGAGTDWTPSSGDYMRCVYDGSTWYCITWDVAIPGADGADGAAGTDSRTVNLTAGQQAFLYLTDDTLNPAENANTTITATALNTVGTPYYEFFLNDVSQQDTTSNTYTYTPQADYANMPDKVEVHITEDGVGGTIYARDQITISGLKPGVDAPLVVQSNEAHSIPVSNLSVHDYTGSGNTISVYLGSTAIAYDDTVAYASPSFRVTNAVGSNITPDATPTENATDITYGNASSMTADTATITYTIVVKNSEGIETTLTRVQSFSRSNQGDDGSDGTDPISISYTNNSHAVPVTNTGTETWTGSGGLFYAYEGTTTLTLDTNTQGTAYPTTPGEYRLNITAVSGDTLTEPAITGATTTTATIAAWAGNLTTVTVYRITAYILTSNSTQVSLATDVTLSPSNQGADGSSLSIGDVDYVAINDPSTTATNYCDFRVNSAGTAQSASGNATPSWATEYTWIGSGETNSDYECRLVTNGNPDPAGTSALTDTWLGCGTTREWAWEFTSSGNVNYSYTIEYRNATTKVVLASGTVNITSLIL